MPAGFAPSSTDLHESGWPRTLAVVWPSIEKVQVTESPTAIFCSAGLNSKSMTSRLPVERRGRSGGDEQEEGGQREHESIRSHVANSLERRNAAS